MRIRVRRVGQAGRRRNAADTALIAGGAVLAGIGLIVLLLAILLALAPWLILAGVIAMAVGWLKRFWYRYRYRRRRRRTNRRYIRMPRQYGYFAAREVCSRRPGGSDSIC